MRACAQCGTSYPDWVEVCARDGRSLIAPGDDPVAGPGIPAAPSMSEPLTMSPLSGSVVQSHVPGLEGDDLTATTAAAQASRSGETFDSLVGATLAGRYQIVRRIGEGGMGAVYEAKHTIIGKRVAVKVLLEKFLTKSDFVARLLQEARLASAIGHEHIVDVTDFGTTDDGRAFVAMEFLDGESLAQLVMREAPLPVERSLRIARQVASALDAAHAKGIVHRDVKPENVYLIRRGEADFVKVVDFGISKAVKQGQGDDIPDYRLTHTGLLLGTPFYMSPEQARGDENLDHRVDIWAMGVMLYECLTGEVPFRANNYLGIISQVLTHTALPPSKLRPELGIPEAVETVVMRAMEKDRDRRYPLMSDLEQDLDRLLAGDQNVGAGVGARPSTLPPPSTAARGRVWVWSAAAAALVVGVAMVLARPGGPSAAQSGSSRAGANSSPSPDPADEGSRSAAVQPAAVPPRAAAVPDPAALVAPSPAARSAGIPASESSADSRESIKATNPSPMRRPIRTINRLSPTRENVDARGGDDIEHNLRLDRKTRKSADPVIRGVLPSRSGEGYPDTN
jgi:eukaryotic-like serine/threonine-protein kinase